MALRNVTAKNPDKAVAVRALKEATGRRSVTMVHHDTGADVFIGHCFTRGSARAMGEPTVWAAVTRAGVYLGSFKGLNDYKQTRGL